MDCLPACSHHPTKYTDNNAYTLGIQSKFLVAANPNIKLLLCFIVSLKVLKTPLFIWLVLLMGCRGMLIAQPPAAKLDFYGDTVSVPAPPAPAAFTEFSPKGVVDFLDGMTDESMQPYLNVLIQYRQKTGVNDWLYYQLVRKVAQLLSPKAANYYRYTLYKWWLLAHSGYDTRLTAAGQYLLFYVQSNETIYNIPYRMQDGKQYVCLNYHDYGSIDFTQYHFQEISLPLTAAARPFSYKVTHLPQFNPSDYTEKELTYEDRQHAYQFHIKLNPQIKMLFTNYPVVDYSLQFNMPLSGPTYQSLIPELKKQVQGWKPKEGVDFLMHFTRYAFLYKPDSKVFGLEKRLSPEQTLLSEYSDCEDRAALFFYLVKEIYNLPMVVLAYPNHVTVAVQFDKAYGYAVDYQGTKYTVCEPTPQRYDLRVGKLLPQLRKQPFQIAYAYRPDRENR